MSPPRQRASARRAPTPPDVQLPDDLEPSAGPVAPGASLDTVALSGLGAAGAHLGALRFLDCRVADCRLDAAALHRARVAASAWTRVSAVGADLSASTWADVEVSDCRLSAARFTGAHLDRGRVEGTRLDGASFRDAVLTDVALAGCSLREADLTGARLTRVTFEGCDLDGVDVSGARLDQVDLRGARLGEPRGLAGLAGAVVTPVQVVELSLVMAAHLGLVVEG